jgi:hypothetical protein
MLPDYRSISEQASRFSQQYRTTVLPHRVWRYVVATGLGVRLGSQWLVPAANEDTLAQALGLFPAPKQEG